MRESLKYWYKRKTIDKDHKKWGKWGGNILNRDTERGSNAKCKD